MNKINSAFSIDIFKLSTPDCTLCGKNVASKNCCMFIHIQWRSVQCWLSIWHLLATGALTDLEWRKAWPQRPHVTIMSSKRGRALKTDQGLNVQSLHRNDSRYERDNVHDMNNSSKNIIITARYLSRQHDTSPIWRTIMWPWSSLCSC